jgi:hypothetical protein
VADINKDNYRGYIKPNHTGYAVITGKINNITGIDIDDRTIYEEWLGTRPEKNHFTVQTNKGVHIYLDASTENNHEYPESVDIRNDNAILISPTNI